MREGFAGRLATRFQNNALTPLLGLTVLLMGVLAALVTPREEEPQIDVTFANVFVPLPGASAARIESLVVVPMEQILSEISGVEHIYSTASPGVAHLTVQFRVGESRNDAILRLYNAVYSNLDWQPAVLGVGQPLVQPKGIDDVPIVALTLWSEDEDRSAIDLARVARTLQTEIQRVAGTRDVYSIGSPRDVVEVELVPERLEGQGITATELAERLAAANLVRHVAEVMDEGRVVPVQAGRLLAGRADVADLVVAVHDDRPVYLQDVAIVRDRADATNQYVWFAPGSAYTGGRPPDFKTPAVTLAVAKKPGGNASDIANEVIARIDALRGSVVPDDIRVEITRNYGITANDKSTALVQKLAFATLSVVVLVVLAMGPREGVIIGLAVTITLAATLFASWAWGFTINRVSLFALIFSIGILVDDAIVVVENVHRRLANAPTDALKVIPDAVDEVGGPTILATLTVISALLPMAFVSGLMGPYMSPIPINASMGMVISLLVAFIFTPWACARWLRPVGGRGESEAEPEGNAYTRFYTRLVRPFLAPTAGRRRRHVLYAGLLIAIALSCALVAVGWVVMKMLPFDDKSELQVVIESEEGTPVEGTARVLDALVAEMAKLPEVHDLQLYAGTSAPINFNGLVRQYDLRSAEHLGDVQVNLVPKDARERSSHEIALAIRPSLTEIAAKFGARLQIVEVPPGPPVRAPIVAEIYAPAAEERRMLADNVWLHFGETPEVVDLDSSRARASPRMIVEIDESKAMKLGVTQAAIVETLEVALAGRDSTFVYRGQERRPVPVRLELGEADKSTLSSALLLEVRSTAGTRVHLSELVRVQAANWDAPIHHKDLRPVDYVMADMAGSKDSPLYGMFALVKRLGEALPDVEQYFFSQPVDPDRAAIKWDGEWQITFATFRDMGLAYSVGLVLIYLLIVAQFSSYAVPLVIMAPIPLTMIGVLPGHALFGAQFTATSMIGVIALAGIIVRNSILLVDFVNQEVSRGTELSDAVARAGAVRSRPIVLTGLAAMLGALFILDDPIFNGLAVTLVSGIFVSTVLTLLVIPIAYFGYCSRRSGASMSRQGV
jgi:multidrug efflux pump subunit AcrB